MSHWIPGKVIVLRPSVDSRIKRFLTDYDVMWVIARHNGYIYFKIKWEGEKETIARCLKADMPKYFLEELFHEKMPFVSGNLSDIRIFPDDFISSKPQGRSDD